MTERLRILILDPPGQRTHRSLEELVPAWEVVRVDNLPEALRRLRQENFDGIFSNPSDQHVLSGLVELLQASRIFQTLADGVVALDRTMRIIWANPAFESWCGGPVAGQELETVLGLQAMVPSPFRSALTGKPTTMRIPFGERHLELHITPVVEASAEVQQFLCLGRDITAETQRQQKLEALHKAGLELAALSTEQIAEMTVEDRIELLKEKIIEFTRDLLRYEVVEIRLLDHVTGLLEPLLEQGMTADAGQRKLYARPQDNGVTGFVAALGLSRLCPDTSIEPLYLQGAQGARSSLTVPLIYQDTVIGTFNVESPNVNAYTEEDLQFAEIFCREIASTLHTLELLSAEIRSTATRSCEAVSREVAMPADDILAAATALINRFIGHDQDLIDKLKKIVAGVRTIKQAIQKVGEEMAPAKCIPGEQEPPQPRLKGKRVLVADDDERVRRMAHGILGRWGCVVETAHDGGEALTLAKLSTYDAIIADIRLPDMTGYEFFHCLREVQPRAHVILMTEFGYDPHHSIVKARQEGLKHILYKPFRVDQLLDALNQDGDGCPSVAVATLAKPGS